MVVYQENVKTAVYMLEILLKVRTVALRVVKPEEQ